MAKTNYIVFRASESALEPVGSFEARTARAACEAALLASGEEEAAYLAVPERFYHLERYRVVTTRAAVPAD